jgi:hypothetical protein
MLLLYDSKFIDDAAVAFERLGFNIKCIEIVNGAISRGLRLRRKALERAARAAEAEGIEELASDIAMLPRINNRSIDGHHLPVCNKFRVSLRSVCITYIETTETFELMLPLEARLRLKW